MTGKTVLIFICFMFFAQGCGINVTKSMILIGEWTGDFYGDVRFPRNGQLRCAIAEIQLEPNLPIEITEGGLKSRFVKIKLPIHIHRVSIYGLDIECNTQIINNANLPPQMEKFLKTIKLNIIDPLFVFWGKIWLYLAEMYDKFRIWFLTLIGRPPPPPPTRFQTYMDYAQRLHQIVELFIPGAALLQYVPKIFEAIKILGFNK